MTVIISKAKSKIAGILEALAGRSSNGGKWFYGNGKFVWRIGFRQVEWEVTAVAVVAGENDHAVEGAGVAHILGLMAYDEKINVPKIPQSFDGSGVVPAVPTEGA